MRVTVRVKLITANDDFYTTYVFQNLDEKENSWMRYISATKPPNWTGQLPEIGDVGFVELEYVNAGDNYYQRNTGNKETYKYTQCYFISFTKQKEENKVKEFKF